MVKDKKSRKGQDETKKEEAEPVTENLYEAAGPETKKKGKKGKKQNDDIDSISKDFTSLSVDEENISSKKVQEEDVTDSKKSKKDKKTAKKTGSKSDDVGNGLLDNSESKSSENSKEINVKPKKGKSKKAHVDSDDDDDVDTIQEKHGKGKASKTKKSKEIVQDEDEVDFAPSRGKPSFALLNIESGDDDDDLKTEDIDLKHETEHSKKSKIKDKKSSNAKPRFELLDVEDESNIPDEEATSNVPNAEVSNKEVKTESKGKKSKKKERKKKDDDNEEDLEKILAELALEMEGKKPPEKENDIVSTEKVQEPVDTAASEVPEKKKKKKKKDNIENKSEVAATEEVPQEKHDTEQKISDVAEKKVAPETEDDGEFKIKTAAQKKKEKKEKEKQKKALQFDQTKKKEKSPSVEADVTEQKETTVKDTEELAESADEDDAGKKKKKKKKDEDDKKGKKRPGRKQVALMQEALKKVREEEERLKLEEEAKQKAAEEAERLRQEKIRLELEKKEKRKQREKEKRERLKAEGKLLTKTQRQNRARMEATLAALRQQGVEIPQIGEKKERVPRLGDKKKTPKKKNGASQDNVKEEDDAEPTVSVNEVKEESPKMEVGESELNEAPESEDEDEEVKDAWDETTEEEESESEQSFKNENLQPSPKKVKREVEDESESSDSEDATSDETDSESSDDSEDEGKRNEAKIKEKIYERIKKRREEAENNRNFEKLRSPVVCVLGHVDTGKTKILDKIRRTHVQDSEAGGITQQIGATMVPQDALKEQCKMVKAFTEMELKIPGLLIIDTPGHESFSNLRSRGSSLCDIAVLVVDIMHGLEPQTIESLNLLRQKKTPFIVALNKIDRLYEWKSLKNRDVQDVIKNQARNTKLEFDDRVKEVVLQFANQGLNAVLFYENKDPRSYISMVPTSALTGDGMGNLMALIVHLTQTMMAKRLAFCDELQATVLEVKAIPGLGTTIDVILVNGTLHEGDTIVLAGHEGALVTQIRSLLMPQPLKELRVKNPYEEYKEVEGAQGVKLTGKDLDKAIAGLNLLVAYHPDEIPILKDEINCAFREAMSSIKLAERGVYVQASTLGSLEALLDFLRTSKIPYSGIRIGPVVKKDVMKASIMLEHDSQYAVILAFDIRIERDAQELADSLGVRIFQADIIYHLFDKFMAYREELKNKKRDELKNVAVFPCKLRILPQYVFNSRDPIVVGVIVEAGVVKEGTPLCVPSKEFLEIGTVTTIEINHKQIETARKGQEVCIKIEPTGGDAPKMYGRHFDHTDMLVSKITRQSIDACKEYFRDDLLKTDWQLMVELKKTFQIL